MCATANLLRRWYTVLCSIDVLRTGFYSGRIAEAVVAATQEGGGVLSAGDLGAHRTAFPNPLSTTYRGHKVVLLTACQLSSAYAFANSGCHHPMSYWCGWISLMLICSCARSRCWQAHSQNGYL